LTADIQDVLEAVRRWGADVLVECRFGVDNMREMETFMHWFFGCFRQVPDGRAGNEVFNVDPAFAAKVLETVVNAARVQPWPVLPGLGLQRTGDSTAGEGFRTPLQHVQQSPNPMPPASPDVRVTGGGASLPVDPTFNSPQAALPPQANTPGVAAHQADGGTQVVDSPTPAVPPMTAAVASTDKANADVITTDSAGASDVTDEPNNGDNF